MQGEFSGAHESICEVLRIFRELGDKRDLVFALYAVGATTCLQGNYELALTYMEEQLALSRELGSQSAVGAGLGLQGMLALERQEFTRAVSLMDEELQIVRGLGIPWGTGLTGAMSQSLKHLGVARLLAGDARGGSALLEEALALARERGDWPQPSRRVGP